MPSSRAPAAYGCLGESQARNSGDPLVPAFRALATDIDACLARPFCSPSRWGQVPDFAFAGERQTIWRDDSSGNPRPEVALKVEEELARRLFYLRLAVGCGA